MSSPELLPEEQQTEIQALERGRALFRKAFLAGVFLALLAFSFFAGYQKGKFGSSFGNDTPVKPGEAVLINTKSEDNTIDFALFWRVWDLVKEKYVDRDNLDAKKLFYGAIDGMMAATGDPYTTFFSPKENKEFQEDISGSFEGIGAEMALKDEVITIVTPLDDSPAKKAGLLPNDRIIKINGEITANITLEEAVSRIRGPRGTEVTLTIFREGEEETREVVVKRDVIVVKSVKMEIRDEIAIIRLSRFGDDSEKDLAPLLREARDKGAKGIVLDMRNNPGGFLDTAVEIAHHFLPSNTLIVQEENAKGERKELRSVGRPDHLTTPLVVLINEGSASASEILAGALRENREDVVLIGKKSFGKGSVQELIPVGKDTSVKITVARWLTPKGNQINTVGISPDIEVSITREDIEAKRDVQLDKALEVIKGKL